VVALGGAGEGSGRPAQAQNRNEALDSGLNEHTNGLFRQYFPKLSDLSIVLDTDVQRVEDKPNSRPRKILDYRTPREVFFNAKNLPVALRC
jgi:transposase, IS30 family